MSLSIQELNAQIETDRFMVKLLHDERVPEELRAEARAVCKHYPYRSTLVEMWLGHSPRPFVTAEEIDRFMPSLRREFSDLLR